MSSTKTASSPISCMQKVIKHIFNTKKSAYFHSKYSTCKFSKHVSFSFFPSFFLSFFNSLLPFHFLSFFHAFSLSRFLSFSMSLLSFSFYKLLVFAKLKILWEIFFDVAELISDTQKQWNSDFKFAKNWRQLWEQNISFIKIALSNHTQPKLSSLENMHGI